MFHAHLRGAEHMPGGMQRHAYAVHDDCFSIRESLHVDARQPRQQHADARIGCEKTRMPEARMIRMRMGDDGARDGPPWIDIKAALGTEQSLWARDDEIRRSVHLSLNASMHKGRITCVQPCFAGVFDSDNKSMRRARHGAFMNCV